MADELGCHEEQGKVGERHYDDQIYSLYITVVITKKIKFSL